MIVWDTYSKDGIKSYSIADVWAVFVLTLLVAATKKASTIGLSIKLWKLQFDIGVGIV